MFSFAGRPKGGGNPPRSNPKRMDYLDSFHMEARAMKHRLLLITAALIGFAWQTPAFAFGGEGAFYEFLGNHPQIRHELEANPNLVNEPGYLRDHPQFKEFYRNHDEV